MPPPHSRSMWARQGGSIYRRTEIQSEPLGHLRFVLRQSLLRHHRLHRTIRQIIRFEAWLIWPWVYLNGNSLPCSFEFGPCLFDVWRKVDVETEKTVCETKVHLRLQRTEEKLVPSLRIAKEGHTTPAVILEDKINSRLGIIGVDIIVVGIAGFCNNVTKMWMCPYISASISLIRSIIPILAIYSFFSLKRCFWVTALRELLK